MPENTESNSTGIKYLDLFWKTIRDDIPTGLDKKTELSTLVGISRTLDVAGHWEEAFERYDQAIELANSIGDKEVLANILRWKGHLHRKRGEWDKALDCTRKSLEICRDLNFPAGEAYAYNNLGTVHFELGKGAEAKEYYERALTIAQDIQEDRLMAQVNNNLGVLAQVAGEQEQAIVAYQQALPSYEREGDTRGMAQTYYNLALSFEETGDENEVEKHLEKSMELAGEIREKNLLAMIYLRKAFHTLHASDVSTAKSFAGMALNLFTELGDRLGIADSHRIEGLIFSEEKKFEESRDAFGKSIEINRKTKCILGLAETLLDSGRFLFKAGDPGEANRTLEESRSLYSELGDAKHTRLIDGLLNPKEELNA